MGYTFGSAINPLQGEIRHVEFHSEPSNTSTATIVTTRRDNGQSSVKLRLRATADPKPITKGVRLSSAAPLWLALEFAPPRVGYGSHAAYLPVSTGQTVSASKVLVGGFKGPRLMFGVSLRSITRSNRG